jgi:hypothetical protein
MEMVVVSKADLEMMIESKIDAAINRVVNTPVLTAPNPDELWTASEISMCGGGHYSRVLEKIRNSGVRTFKKGRGTAIQYKTIAKLGITVNPFLKSNK